MQSTFKVITLINDYQLNVKTNFIINGRNKYTGNTQFNNFYVFNDLAAAPTFAISQIKTVRPTA